MQASIATLGLDGFVDRALQALLIDHELGLADGGDILRCELDVVWLGAGLGQARDRDVVTADLLCGELQRVERRDDGELTGAGLSRLTWIARPTRPAGAADVVSAASVLCQAPDPAELLSNLWAAVRPGGSLLLVETTQLLSVGRIRRASERDDRRSRQVLGLWARARQGRALPDDVYETVPAASRRFVPLLDGCVQAVVLTRNA